jgi:hypothetical protein
MAANSRKLKSDGAYTGDHGNICAYSPAGCERKQLFLRDARAMLRETGRRLAAGGLTQMEVRVNAGGIAVSGEVYAEFWDPANPLRHVWVEVSATSIRSLSGRRDGASIMARVQLYRPSARQQHPRGHGSPLLERDRMGPNLWLSPELTSAQLAERLRLIYDPQQSPREGMVFTAGKSESLALPPLTVANDDEERQAVHQWKRIEAAVAADQQLAADPDALPLFDGPPSDEGSEAG